MAADDNEIERRQFMQKPVPAKPKVPGGVSQVGPMIQDRLFVPPPPESEYSPFADFATIVKLLRRHDRATRLQILELVTELID